MALCAAALGVSTAGAQPVLPDFSAAEFDDSLNIDNPYFPLVPHTTLTFDGAKTDPVTGEEEQELIVVEVLNEIRSVAGIDARVVRDRVWLEGLLIEDTYDWYAQDNDGNVWYLGENVTDYEYDDQGNLIGTSHPGAWETGVDGALPGHVMEANPAIDDHYYQEFYPGEAEDHAQIVGLGENVTVPFGAFEDVLRTRDFTMSSDSYGEKSYAPGVGVVKEQDFDGITGALLGTTTLRSVTVPEPGSAILTICGAGALLLRMRRRGG